MAHILRNVGCGKFNDLFTQSFPVLIESEICNDKHASLTGTIVNCLKGASIFPWNPGHKIR